jgi:phage-related holin
MPGQFEMSQLRHVFEKLGEFFHMKLFFAYLFTLLSWIFDGSLEIVVTIFLLILIDTFTGTLIALRNKRLFSKGLYSGPEAGIFSSRGMYRGPLKLTVYFIFILVSRLVDKHIPLPFASPMIDTFIVTTESYSIFENFGKMGFAAPTALIEKLKNLSLKKE